MQSETTTVITAVKQDVRLREWAEQLEAQQASGLTVPQWCAENGIKTKSFYYRLRRVRNSISSLHTPSFHCLYRSSKVQISRSRRTVCISHCRPVLHRIRWSFFNRMDDITRNAGTATMEFLPIGIRFGNIKNMNDLFNSFRKEYDNSIKYHSYPWAGQNAVHNDYPYIVYEASFISDRSYLEKLGFTPIFSIYSDPEALLGPRQFIQIYKHPNKFTILNIYSSSKIKPEVIAEYAEQQKIIFEKLFNDNSDNTETFQSLFI